MRNKINISPTNRVIRHNKSIELDMIMMMMQKAKGRKTIGDILFRDLVATFAFKAGIKSQF